MSYTTDIENWRAAMEASLRAEDGWLALAGLFWLREGSNSIGANDSADVILPAGTAPALIGHFERAGERVTLLAQPGVALLVNNEPVNPAGQALRNDANGAAKPDMVTIGSLVMFVIARGDRIGIRLRDTQHPKRQQFEGRKWYPIRPEYRVQATFISYETPQTIAIPNILGDIEQQLSPGYATFELAGQQCRLVPTSSGNRLFFIVRDATSSNETYGVGRFLVADAPHDGIVTLDFNQLYNPPCAFTDYATCPMPPRENHLIVPIEAGELYTSDLSM